MPSPRKRIGFLPRPKVQEVIKEIANKEKLSQSKVVGELVEEALLARGIIAPQSPDDIKKKSSFAFDNNKQVYSSSYLYNDINELISDKGITYDKKSVNMKRTDMTNNKSINEEKHDAELFKKFQKFLEFQKSIESE